MRKSVRAELRMLRELAYHFLTGGTVTMVKGVAVCDISKKPLLDYVSTTFGHRNHKPVKAKLTIHHHNWNHDDNRPKNRRVTLSSAHKSFHAGNGKFGAKAVTR